MIGDPEIGDGELVLFAPLIGLELDDLPDPLLAAGFPLSWLWPSQVGSFEDPDIRRDWMSRHTRRRAWSAASRCALGVRTTTSTPRSRRCGSGSIRR